MFDIGDMWRRADRKWVRETTVAFFLAAWSLLTLMHVAAIAQSAGRNIIAILPWAILNGLKYAVPVALVVAIGLVFWSARRNR